MAIFDNFPYTNVHELNLDWLIRTVKNIKEKVDDLDDDLLDKISQLSEIYNKTGSVLYMFPNLTTGGYSGNSSLVITPSKTILMDCGPATDWNDIRQYYDDLYARELFKNIDYIVISHYHYDHIENLANILARYPHKNCVAYIPLSPDGYYASTPTLVNNYNTVVTTLQNANVDFIEVDKNITFEIDNDFTSMELFNSTPLDYQYYSTNQTVYNDYSMVGLFKCGNIYAMFPGDIQQAAQKHIFETRLLPRLFLYVVHHHGIQNDDYRPFLEAIQPEYSIIMTSHNRALVSAASSFSGNYLSGDVGSTGFGSYAYVSNKDAGSIIDGIAINKIGWAYSYIDLYVDNEYVGNVYNGEQDTPFTEINEALMFVRPNANLHYRIHVKKTNTPYEYMWVRDFTSAIEIICETGTEIDGAYIRNSSSISITGATFNGAGRLINNNPTIFYNWASNVYIASCDIDGANLQGTGTKTGILIRETYNMYVTGCTFSNLARGTSSYRYAGLTVNGNTFNDVGYCYNLGGCELSIRATDTISNVTNWLLGSTSTARAFSINRDNINATLLAKIGTSVVSQPFYYDASNPVCVIQGTNIYNILTGNTVSI